MRELRTALAVASAPKRLTIAAVALFATILLAAGGGAVVSSAACPIGAAASSSSSGGSTELSKEVPKELIPIYEDASEKYGLGEQGVPILAAINSIETAFGTNLGPSSAGAYGWMQFMPATWDAYGVDGDGDGDKDPADPEDGIFGAANYLKALGAPGDWHDAIYGYNHAEWYVDDVLETAERFAGYPMENSTDGGSRSGDESSPTPSGGGSLSVEHAAMTRAYEEFVGLVAEGTGLSPRVVAAWVIAEGGPDDNPLNIGPGQKFRSIEAGARATIELLKANIYGGIMAAAKNGSDSEQIEAIVESPWCGGLAGCPGYEELLRRIYAEVKVAGELPSSSGDPAAMSCGEAEAVGGPSGPANLKEAEKVFEPREYRTVTGKYGAYGQSEQVDARIYDNVVWVLETYDLALTDALSGTHASHGNGAALDMVPANDTSQEGWDDSALRLAHDIGWIESCGASGVAPACPLKPAFRFVGYEGYPSHGSPKTCSGGCPAHIHVSWANSTGSVGPLAPEPAEWIMVFPSPSAAR